MGLLGFFQSLFSVVAGFWGKVAIQALPSWLGEEGRSPQFRF